MYTILCLTYILYVKNLQAAFDVRDLSHLTSVLKAENGENGHNKSCFGKNAEHTVVHVPIGTIVRNIEGHIIADLNQKGMMFIAARGGAGGHGNAFFKSDVYQVPRISEYGANGEDLQYVLEISSMAHVGLVSNQKLIRKTIYITFLLIFTNLIKNE